MNKNSTIITKRKIHKELHIKLNTTYERCGRDRMVFGFTTTRTSSAWSNEGCELKSYSRQGVLDKTSWDIIRSVTSGSSTNKIDGYDKTEILLKVGLNIIILKITSAKIRGLSRFSEKVNRWHIPELCCLLISFLIDIYRKCRTMNPSTNTGTTSTGNIQGWSQKK